MKPLSDQTAESLAPALARAVALACDQFGAAWKAGTPPRVEDFLTQVPEPARPVLLRELLAQDINYRRQHGEHPRAEDYAGRFPDLPKGWLAALPTADPGPPREGSTFLPAAGTSFSRYHILSTLGAGGMGTVFRARDRELRREVALKQMKPELAAQQELRARFLREARAMAAVTDEHVVVVYDVGEADGCPYFVMPLLRGETLAARLERQGALPPREVIRLGEQVARGLAAAHARRLVHRDLKPSNIWLQRPPRKRRGAQPGRDQVKLLDFGLVRAGASASGAAPPESLTTPGMLLGTVSYMAPEQAEDPRRADARSDLFSLGCVLYDAATGRHAFDGPTPLSILRQLATVDPPPPTEVNPAVPPALSAVIMELLTKDPAGRPASAVAVARRLRKLQGRREPAGAPGQLGRRGIGARGAAVVVMLLLATVLISIFRGSSGSPGKVPLTQSSGVPGTPDLAGLNTKPLQASLSASDRDVAEWALRLGAREVGVAAETGEQFKVGPQDKLPAGRLRLLVLDLSRTNVQDADLARLSHLTSLEFLRLSETRVTDAGLKHLKDLRVPYLTLGLEDGPRITDAGAELLGQMMALGHLGLDGALITDAGLEHLKKLRHLRVLTLNGVLGITSKGLGHLKELPNLESLYLQRTRISEADLRAFQAEAKSIRDVQW